MDRPADLGRLDNSQWERLQDLADRFEDAWQRADTVELEPFLPPPGDPLRPAALHELIKTELEIRWRRHRGAPLEDYLRKFPELGPARALSPELIYEEYRVRQLHGDRPPLTEYRSRFPDQLAEVERLAREQPARSSAPAPPPRAAPPIVPESPRERVIQSGDGYRFFERIGGGTFAEVYRGEAPGGVPVAIKRVIKPIDAEEANRELQALELIKQLRHPFLLATQAYWVADGRLYIVTELADGTLRDRLKECRKETGAGIPPGELLAYLTQSAQAIDFLHKRHVLHRDIKPENILLSQSFAKVADFGLARGLLNDQMSATGAGTPRYMPPEVWRGTVCPASDQYGLALTYAELRLGGWPFPGQSMWEVMEDHLHGTPDLSALPEAEQQVLLRALAKEPGQRHPGCQAFAQALQEALAGGPPGRGGVTPPLQRPTDSLPAPLSREDSPPTVVTVPPPAETPVTETRDEFRTLIPNRARPTAPTPSAQGGKEDTERETRARETNGSATAPDVPDTETAQRPPDGHSSPLAERAETRSRSERTTMAVLIATLLLAVALAGAAGWWFLWSPGPSFSLVLGELESPRLSAGEAKTVTVSVVRSGRTGPIHLTFDQLPPGFRVKEATIPADRASVAVTLMALPDATPGASRVRLRARADGGSREAAVEVSIGGPCYHLPSGWRRAETAGVKVVAEEGRVYYDRIEVVRGGIAVPFLLIPRGERDENRPFPIPSFYIMEDKVWVGLYRKFAVHDLVRWASRIAAAARPDLACYLAWRVSRDRYDWLTIAESLPVNQHNEHPVMGVIAPDAHRCALWLGGKLPLPMQWDKAAGRYARDRGAGPFRQDTVGQIAVGRGKKGTLARGAAKSDVSLFGVRDMAGNGLEWTGRALSPDIEGDISGLQRDKNFDNLGENFFVVLRGQRYTAERPLAYKDWSAFGKFFPWTIDPEIGFRVVIEP